MKWKLALKFVNEFGVDFDDYVIINKIRIVMLEIVFIYIIIKIFLTLNQYHLRIMILLLQRIIIIDISPMDVMVDGIVIDPNNVGYLYI